MSKQHDHGYVISRGDNYVIREKIVNGKLVLTVHQRADGVELLPLGYMLGHNRLETPAILRVAPMTKFTGVRPQRHNGRAWVDCDIHASQQWAVYYNSDLVGRYSTKARANQILASEHIRRASPPRTYRLGSRMPKREHA